MAYLEGIRAIHNDLRAANVLVAEDHSVKISDFELTKLNNSYPYSKLYFTSLNDLCSYMLYLHLYLLNIVNRYSLCYPLDRSRRSTWKHITVNQIGCLVIWYCYVRSFHLRWTSL